MKARLTLAIALLTCEATVARAQFVPPPAIPMPFAEKRKIDVDCRNEGHHSSEAKRLSNLAKNNFAAPAPAIPITFGHLAALQGIVDADPIKYPSNGGEGYLIQDRATLQNLVDVQVAGLSTPVKIGEGHRVVLVGYVITARHANTSALDVKGQPPNDGERVNCESGAMNRNDIHIELAERKRHIVDRSRRVTAEISPHFRPMSWERFDTDSRTAPKVVDIPDINDQKQLEGKPGIVELKGQRIRVYGQLYFDDVHRPCPWNGRCGRPSRLSTWEVHPVYLIDIDVNGEWVPFHEWAAIR